LLNDGLQRASDPDAIAAHDRRLLFAGFIQEEGFELLGIICAELEDMPNFYGSLDLERFAAFHARLTRLDQSQIGPFGHGDVSLDADVAPMEAIFVGAG